MTNLDILKTMLKVSAFITIDRNRCVNLTEPQCSSSHLNIHGIPQESIIIKVDSFKSPDSVFEGKNGECSRADYAIISEYAQKKYIVYIEMKKTTDSEHKRINQLAGAKCFISYCKEIGKFFWKENKFLDGFEDRFVSICHTGSIRKRETKIEKKQKGIHNMVCSPKSDLVGLS